MPTRVRVYPSESEKPRVLNKNGEFDGSFVGTVRRSDKVNCTPWYRRRSYYLEGWTDPSIWRAAVIEAIASAMLIFLSAQWAATVIGYGTKQVGGYIGFFNTALISVFVYATAPASGGHLNPLISWSTMFCGLCPIPRGVLYILFQILGASVAGAILRGCWGYEKSVEIFGGGCYFDPTTISPGQVLLTEVMSAWTVVFLGIGLGLDPRQSLVFGPQLGPLLVGLAVAVVTTATSGMVDGYFGAQVYPSRCLATAIARGSFAHHWIWWVGPALGGLANAALYNLIPPYHAEKHIDQPSDSEA